MADEKIVLKDAELEKVSGGMNWKKRTYLPDGTVIITSGSGTIEQYREAVKRHRALVEAAQKNN